jgi:hypothetical protein
MGLWTPRSVDCIDIVSCGGKSALDYYFENYDVYVGVGSKDGKVYNLKLEQSEFNFIKDKCSGIVGGLYCVPDLIKSVDLFKILIDDVFNDLYRYLDKDVNSYVTEYKEIDINKDKYSDSVVKDDNYKVINREMSGGINKKLNEYINGCGREDSNRSINDKNVADDQLHNNSELRFFKYCLSTPNIAKDKTGDKRGGKKGSYVNSAAFERSMERTRKLLKYLLPSQRNLTMMKDLEGGEGVDT